jgi:hypothetical protein
MPRWKGVRYRVVGSPEWYYDEDGNEAPPEAVEHFTRKWMMRSGLKPAGRRKMTAGQTIDELRLDLLESGISEEQIAKREGIDIESLRKSFRRGRQR